MQITTTTFLLLHNRNALNYHANRLNHVRNGIGSCYFTSHHRGEWKVIQARTPIHSLSIILLLLLLCTPALGDTKIYWHFTFKAFLDKTDPAPAEWAWVTMVETPRAEAFPDQASTAQRYGGNLSGTVFAMVRGAAWRSQYSYTQKKNCKGRPAEMEVFWEESWSDKVYAGGQLTPPYQTTTRSGETYIAEDEFRFGFTTRPILRENGRWFDPKGRASVFVGPIHTEGSTAEDIRGRFKVQGVNYIDPLKHYRRCGKAWVKQYKSAFRKFEVSNLLDSMSSDNEIFGQVPYGPRDEKNIAYFVVRSTSREHPNWRRQEM